MDCWGGLHSTGPNRDGIQEADLHRIRGCSLYLGGSLLTFSTLPSFWLLCTLGQGVGAGAGVVQKPGSCRQQLSAYECKLDMIC